MDWFELVKNNESATEYLGNSCHRSFTNTLLIRILNNRRVFIMDKKIKLLAAVSVIAVMTSGCSRYGTGVGSDGYATSGSNKSAGSGQVARTGQVSGGGLFGQRRSSTCAPCAANSASKNTYTYKPAAKPVYKAAPKPKVAGQHNQQYYIDKWNREQAQNKQQNTQNYTGYGNTGASNATYYDYSSAGKTTTPAPAANVSASNKSIYTGSYQQPTYKPYQPTTYAGGSAATTNTTTTYSGAATASAGGGTYVVKKGDTVFEVMRQTGVYWKDIISLNNLVAPAYTINPGQTLRLK